MITLRERWPAWTPVYCFPITQGLDPLNTFQVLPLIYSNPENYVMCCGERQGRMLVSSSHSVLGYSSVGLGLHILTFWNSPFQPSYLIIMYVRWKSEIWDSQCNVHRYNHNGLLHQMNQHNILLTCLNTQTKQEMNWVRSQESDYQQQETKI